MGFYLFVVDNLTACQLWKRTFLQVSANSYPTSHVYVQFILHKVEHVQSNVQVSDGDKLMLNYDSEQKGKKERSRKKCEEKKNWLTAGNKDQE